MTVLKPGKLYIVKKMTALRTVILRETDTVAITDTDDVIFMYVRHRDENRQYPHEILAGTKLMHIHEDLWEWCEEVPKP